MDRIDTVQDLIKIANKLPSNDYVGGWFYRGQPDADWAIQPKAYRHPYCEGDNFTFKFKMWLKQAFEYSEMEYGNELEAMAIAQHHGLATKLLDWSSNILTAAFFACNSNFDKDGMLYIYFPTQYAYCDEGVLVPGGEPERVVGYQPKVVVKRLQSQSAYFTYHKEPNFKIERSYFKPGGHDTLYEYLIPAEAKISILLMLDRLSINYKTLFPDLDGLSKHHCLLDEIRALKK